jgi:hypothetical protein
MLPPMMRPHFLLPLLFALVAGCAPVTSDIAAPQSRQGAAAYFDAIRGDPLKLSAFLRRMPKGGDLHNHLSGAIYAENFIRWAADNGACIHRVTLAVVAKTACPGSETVPATEAFHDGALYAALIDAWSMRGFVPGPQSGHDHFFATFAKFDAAEDGHDGDMLAEVARRAAGETVDYLELMWSPGMGEARALGKKLGWDPDLAHFRTKLLAAGIDKIVARARHKIDLAEAAERQTLHCGEPAALPGCAVTLRYLAQTIRTAPPEQAFAQFVLAFALVEADPRFVGLNLVAPEDDPVALHEYGPQMRMLGFLDKLDPKVKIALHAGELTLGLVPPEDLRFHIRDAVEIAGARRIGHGIDIFYEDDPAGLMAEMAAKRVMVEINLTSNDLILEVSGNRHPFMDYRRAGVPVALSTDDAGVSRIDLTHEYVRAAETYGLSYADLKDLARNSLEYAFLPGASLWQSIAPFTPVAVCGRDAPGAGQPSGPCHDFLAASERAAEQWRLEEAFADFDAAVWPAP